MSSNRLIGLAFSLLLSACAAPPEGGPGLDPSLLPPPAPELPMPVAPTRPAEPEAEPPSAPRAPEPGTAAAPQVDARLREDFDAALALLRDGRHEAAIKSFQALHQRRPELSGPLLNQAIAHLAAGQDDAAEPLLRRALALRDSAPGWNQLGLLLRRSGRLRQAQQAYQKALDVDPDYAYAHLNLGVLCELYLGDPECALEQYRQYLQTEPADAEQVRLWIFDLEQRLRER